MTKLDENYYKDPHTLLANLEAFPDIVQEVKRILENRTDAGYLDIGNTIAEIRLIQEIPLEVWAYVYYIIYYSYPRNGKVYLGNYYLYLPGYEHYHLCNLKPLETFMTEAQLEKYAPANILRREKARRAQALRDAELSTIKLDEFSYTLFENALKASGKITIKDSLKYFDRLHKLMSLKDDEKTQRLAIKYIKIIFDATRSPNKEVCSAVNRFQHLVDYRYCKDMPFVCLDLTTVQTIPDILKELKDHTKVSIDFSSMAMIIEHSTGIVADEVLSICNLKTPFGYYMSDKIVEAISRNDILEDSHNDQKEIIIMYTLLLYTSQFNEVLKTSAWFKIILNRLKEYMNTIHEDIQELVKSIAQLKHYFTATETIISKMEEAHVKKSLCHSS